MLEMAALAANASAALELLEDGIHSDVVLRGLAEGEEFCAFLEKGGNARATRESFSAAGLAAEEFMSLVLSTNSGQELANKVYGVSQQLHMLHLRLKQGLPLKNFAKELEELRDYFYIFARALTHQDALRERIARELESQR
jgi:hypothetical protein